MGPAPYKESRSSDGDREFTESAGSVGTPSGEPVSNVMSWSRNCLLHLIRRGGKRP
jgi:hypothetical protein